MRLPLLPITLTLAFFSTSALAQEPPLTPDDAVLAVTQPAQTVNSDPNQQLRHRAQQEAALAYGAQSGHYARWHTLERQLMARNAELSQIFNFSIFYLDKGLVQPPILDVGANITQIEPDGQRRKQIGRVYRVLAPAAFRQRPLNWQTFLLPESLRAPATPRVALLPINREERNQWDHTLRQGWEQGVLQADDEFRVRLASLQSAYQGMALYTRLAMQGMVQAPVIKHRHQAVSTTRDGQKMAVDEQRQVISKKSYFVGQPNRWQPLVYHHDFGSQVPHD